MHAHKTIRHSIYYNTRVRTDTQQGSICYQFPAVEIAKLDKLWEKKQYLSSFSTCVSAAVSWWCGLVVFFFHHSPCDDCWLARPKILPVCKTAAVHEQLGFNIEKTAFPFNPSINTVKVFIKYSKLCVIATNLLLRLCIATEWNPPTEVIIKKKYATMWLDARCTMS